MNKEYESGQLNECCTPTLYQLCNALLIPKRIAPTCPALNKQKINLEAMSTTVSVHKEYR
jgi:hypothetical protein